ncbi:MAG: hypothetical protein U9N34_08590, partial [Candidatus Cloacimonadota bacterium]|nr:hypothetical protein [Candidatus Cloacimonadota bacterium]
FNANELNFVENNGEYLPFLFYKKGSIFHHFAEKIEIRKDIISSAFYFLSGWDEFIKKKKITIENRFNIADTLQYKRNFVELPIVDRYCEIFDSVIIHIFPKQKQSRRWEKGKDFVVTLTHDIDYFPFWTKKHLNEIIDYNKNRLKTSKRLIEKIKAIYKYIGHSIHKKWFYNHEKNLKKIIKKEKKLGVNSTFFMLSEHETKVENQNYFLEHNKILKKILKDSDVGLHGSQKTAHFEENLKLELNHFEENEISVNKYRTHYLAFSYHKSFSILENQGIEVDSSLAFWEDLGFRAGVSYPFYPYNIKEDRQYKVIEIPLMIMDVTLFSPKALGLNSRQAWIKLKRIIDNAKKHHSHICLLWHTITYDFVDFGNFGKLYFKTIKYAKKKNGIIIAQEDLKKRWLDRINKLTH